MLRKLINRWADPARLSLDETRVRRSRRRWRPISAAAHGKRARAPAIRGTTARTRARYHSGINTTCHLDGTRAGAVATGLLYAHPH